MSGSNGNLLRSFLSVRRTSSRTRRVRSMGIGELSPTSSLQGVCTALPCLPVLLLPFSRSLKLTRKNGIRIPSNVWIFILLEKWKCQDTQEMRGAANGILQAFTYLGLFFGPTIAGYFIGIHFNHFVNILSILLPGILSKFCTLSPAPETMVQNRTD